MMSEKSANKRANLYGPVLSRRLGLSLGVDLVPFKVCSFDCIYCQLGRTTRKTNQRESFYPPDDILDQIKSELESGTAPDYITFSGSGEPTLNADLGWLIRGVKEITRVPVAVITNSSLLLDSTVQEELLAADLIMPSLDAGSESVFQRVNRPHAFLRLEKVVAGLAHFRAQYKGEIRLEVLLMDGVNAAPKELERIRHLVDLLDPDRIDLNTVVRPPAEIFARPLTSRRLEEIRDLFGVRAAVVAEPPPLRQESCPEDIQKTIMQMLGRRPCTVGQLATVLGRHRHEVAKLVTTLLRQGLISQEVHGSQSYLRSTQR